MGEALSARGVSANTIFIWTLMAAIAAADAFGLHVTGLRLAPGLLFSNITAIACLLALSAVYTRLRPEPRIATLAHAAAVTLAFSAATMLLSYLAVKAGRPLVDSALVAADRALGLDWRASRDWIAAHGMVRSVFFFAYYSLILQMILLLVVLNFQRRTARCWEMMWLFMASVLGCTAFSVFFPAEGAFGYFHAEPLAPYVRVFRGLRDGSLAVVGARDVQGIIQFPSLHVALAIVYTYVARGVKRLFPFLLVLNILLFLATPAIGGHHFADLWGGAALAAVLILSARAFAARNGRSAEGAVYEKA